MEQEHILPEEQEPEKLGTPLTILSFCIPLAGAIIYFSNKANHPEKAQTACYAAIAGLVVGVIVRVLTMAAGGH